MSIHVATLTGPVDLCNPDPRLITPAAISHGLARINRWIGGTMLPINVAQHSVLVLHIFRHQHPALAHHAIHALIHDGHEYLIGDWADPPVKLLALRVKGIDSQIDAIKHALDVAIRQALGLSEPAIDTRAAVHQADMIARAIEWPLMPAANGPCPWPKPPRGLPTRIKPLTWQQSEILFRHELERELADQLWEHSP